MKGIITETKGSPDPHEFFIDGEDGNKYFAHLGDIEDNEYYLYGKRDAVTYLQKDDEVEFVPWDNNIKKAFKVKKLDSF